jgi:hypothetical protein
MSSPLKFNQAGFKQAQSGLALSALVGCIVAMVATVFVGCNGPAKDSVSEIQLVNQTVELACGKCQFKLPGSGCDLAIRVDGKAYFVDGSSIDDHGDAHAEDGLCNAIRKAKVSGTLRDGRFKAEKIEVVND